MFAVFEAMFKSSVLPLLWGVRFQPVDTGEVAQRLVELTLAPAAGLVPDLAGPRVYSMDEMAQGYLRATGKRRIRLNLPLSGGAARAVRDGAILSLQPPTERRTWEQHLADRAQVPPCR